MGMIFCKAAVLGVLLSGITLNTSLLGEMSASDLEKTAFTDKVEEKLDFGLVQTSDVQHS